MDAAPAMVRYLEQRTRLRFAAARRPDYRPLIAERMARGQRESITLELIQPGRRP